MPLNAIQARTAETCTQKGIHRQAVQTARREMPDTVVLYALAEFFKLFGDSTRIGILWALSVSEMCVCDLCAVLRMKQSAVSHQLKTLKQARIVRPRREGRMVYYALDDEHIRQVLNLGMTHSQEPPV
jgi:DNA-binding transcriptional ArsR family regulator